MKGQTQIKLMVIGLVIATTSPIFGAYIIDEDGTKKTEAVLITFIPLGIGASLMFIAMRDSDEEKAQQNNDKVKIE